MKDLVELAEVIEKEIRDLGYPKSPALLYDPIDYIMGLKAKRIRPLLVLMAYQLFDDDIQRAIAPAMAIEVFHNFTLLHDDIMDKAPLRRGSLTVHEKWNSNIAILSGDVMMIKAYQLLAKVSSRNLKEVLAVFSKTAIEVCEGQQWDMNFETQKNVNLIEYMKMIEYKTAVLLAASLQIGGIMGGASKEEQKYLYNFGINMGIAFQLKDDLLDVFGRPQAFGKKVGGDILANKKTFLYLKSLELSDHATKNKLQDYYMNNDTPELKVKLVKEIFKELNIQQHTTDIMKSHYKKAMSCIDAIKCHNKEPLILFSNKLMERIS